MYKTLNELAPGYLQCLFTQSHVNDYNLRNLEGKLSLPKPNTNYLKRSFCFSGTCLWNNLPQDLIKSVGSVRQFKRGIEKLSEISDSHTIRTSQPENNIYILDTFYQSSFFSQVLLS